MWTLRSPSTGSLTALVDISVPSSLSRKTMPSVTMQRHTRGLRTTGWLCDYRPIASMWASLPRNPRHKPKTRKTGGLNGVTQRESLSGLYH